MKLAAFLLFAAHLQQKRGRTQITLKATGWDKEINWLPTSGSIPMMTPLMRLYWSLPNALDGTWTPPSAVGVQ
jgi:hypothetical protein